MQSGNALPCCLRPPVGIRMENSDLRCIPLFDADATCPDLKTGLDRLNDTGFRDVTVFQGGIARVAMPGILLAAYHKRGEVLFEFRQAATACAFRDGLAAFADAPGLWGLVDTKGKVAVDPVRSDVVPMSGGGLIAVKGIWPDGKNYLFRKGCLVRPAVGTRSIRGSFPRKQGDPARRPKGRMGFIDRNGNRVIRSRFRDAGSFLPNGDGFFRPCRAGSISQPVCNFFRMNFVPLHPEGKNINSITDGKSL